MFALITTWFTLIFYLLGQFCALKKQVGPRKNQYKTGNQRKDCLGEIQFWNSFSRQWIYKANSQFWGNIQNVQRFCQKVSTKRNLGTKCKSSQGSTETEKQSKTWKHELTTFDQMKTRLQVLHEDHEDIKDHQLRQHLNKRERTGHWIIWHDHSNIASSDFMPFLVREVFDPAVHLTN